MKNLRHEKILEIISKENIGTQNMLTEALRKAGIESTQATISRDINSLGLVKEIGNDGRYHYVSLRKDRREGYSDRLKTIFRESVTSVAHAQNLVVIKTLPGLASAACSAVDSMEFPGFIGSLAGDDTAFIAMEDESAAERFSKDISDMLQSAI